MFSLAKIAVHSPSWGRSSPRIVSAVSTRLQPQATHRFSRASDLCSSSILRFSSPFSTYLFTRRYRSLAPESAKAPASTRLPQTFENDADVPTLAEQRKSDWKIILRLMGNVWPKNDWSTRGRVLFGLSLLVGGKV
jgi:ATP-binding cassette, subfamily B (MDR/TAP), member 7